MSSSHGSYVAVSGRVIGRLLNVKPTIAAGSPVDVTSVDSPMLGSGRNSRIVRQYDCSMVEPGSVTATMLGLPGVGLEAGKLVPMTVYVAGYTLSGEGYLSGFEPEANVGEFVRCSVTFQFTGF